MNLKNNPVVNSLILINVFCFLLFSYFPELVGTFALQPLGVKFHFYQLVTYMFIHGGILHLLFNMLTLFFFGNEVEDRLGINKFIVFYAVAGLGSGIFHLIFYQLLGTPAPAIGASGAIWGVLMAYLIFWPTRKIRLFFIAPVSAWILISFVLLLEILSIGKLSGTSHLGHVGGAFFGAAWILLLKYFESRQNLAKTIRKNEFHITI